MTPNELPLDLFEGIAKHLTYVWRYVHKRGYRRVLLEPVEDITTVGPDDVILVHDPEDDYTTFLIGRRDRMLTGWIAPDGDEEGTHTADDVRQSLDWYDTAGLSSFRHYNWLKVHPKHPLYRHVTVLEAAAALLCEGA